MFLQFIAENLETVLEVADTPLLLEVVVQNLLHIAKVTPQNLSPHFKVSPLGQVGRGTGTCQHMYMFVCVGWSYNCPVSIGLKRPYTVFCVVKVLLYCRVMRHFLINFYHCLTKTIKGFSTCLCLGNMSGPTLHNVTRGLL